MRRDLFLRVARKLSLVSRYDAWMQYPAPRVTVRTRAAILLTALTACGGVVIVDGEGAGGSDAIDCEDVSFDFDVVVEDCSTASTCNITGKLPDGRTIRETCLVETQDCRLFIDDVEQCVCPKERLSFTNTCSNAAPTCNGWTINYSNIEFCEQP